MYLKQLASTGGIIVAAAYAIIATAPFWPLVVALAALSGYNLSTATHQRKADR
ncbi:hypothetical protein [Corynebacterium sp.]|uniref:hypothetical protein n=1 Tax=Corynebacterium sp. TaxID=1720 RepID=UPI0026DC9522|nr:hypothetical protein [Corynebacterium sp.]MDO5033077.1 hypothetical protein [Corynebacterium sp.]